MRAKRERMRLFAYAHHLRLLLGYTRYLRFVNALHLRFCLIVIIVVLAAGLTGCAVTGRNLGMGNKYEDTSLQGLKQMQKDRMLSDDSPLDFGYDLSAAKKLPEMTGDELERLGDAFLAEGNLPMAFVHYEKSLKRYPESEASRKSSARVHYKKGLTLLLGKRNIDAIKAFQEAVRIDPSCAVACEGIGQAFFQMKKYDEAERNFRKAVKLDPNLWRSHNFLGIICDYQKRFKEAVDQYAAAILLMPDEGLLYNNLGVACLMSGEYEKAASAFYKALEVGYKDKKVYNNLGLALSRSGKYKEAMDAFMKGGDPSQAYNNLGCIYLEQGKNEEAVECFTRAIEVNPSFYDIASENLRKAKTGDDNKISGR